MNAARGKPKEQPTVLASMYELHAALERIEGLLNNQEDSTMPRPNATADVAYAEISVIVDEVLAGLQKAVERTNMIGDRLRGIFARLG